MNEQYGLWTIIGEPRRNRHGKLMYPCRCKCGVDKEVYKYHLINRASTSCRKCSATKHGLAYSPVYTLWFNIKQRCENPKAVNYKYYGGKGITVCESWQDREVFLNWALKNGWVEGLYIDRLDNNGPYSPDNCRFSTSKESAANRSPHGTY